MIKTKKQMIKEGSKCFFYSNGYASECFISNIDGDNLNIISDIKLKNGENITIQYDKYENYKSVPVFLNAKVRKNYGGFNGGSFFYNVVLG